MSNQAVEKRPSAALSGRLTVSAAWQEVAPYSSRRHPSSRFSTALFLTGSDNHGSKFNQAFLE
jgi:hypothetical protein